MHECIIGYSEDVERERIARWIHYGSYYIADIKAMRAGQGKKKSNETILMH